MKKIAILLVGLLLLSLGFNACKKDEPEGSREKVIPEMYAKKWLVNTNQKSVDYISIEITEYGYYFILFDDNSSVSGTCYVDGDDNIILVNYGYIEVLDVDGEVFSFILHIDDTNEAETIFTTEAEEMEVTDETDLLCVTWHISEYYFVSGNDTTWAQPSDTYDFSVFDVTFTTYGTYFTHEEYSYQGTPSTLYENRYWRWTNDDNDEICYGLTQDQADECGYSAEITTLTDGELIMEGTTTNVYGQSYHFYVKGTAY